MIELASRLWVASLHPREIPSARAEAVRLHNERKSVGSHVPREWIPLEEDIKCVSVKHPINLVYVLFKPFSFIFIANHVWNVASIEVVTVRNDFDIEMVEKLCLLFRYLR